MKVSLSPPEPSAPLVDYHQHLFGPAIAAAVWLCPRLTTCASKRNWRSMSAEGIPSSGGSFVISICTQSNHWINLRSSSCREIPGQQRDRSQEHNHPDKRKRISGGSLKKKRSNHARKHDRGDKSNRDADQRESQCRPDHIELHPRIALHQEPCGCRSPAFAV